MIKQVLVILLLISAHAQTAAADDASYLVVLSKGADASEYWICAFDSNYKTVYFVLKEKQSEPIASPGSLVDVDRGPSLENAFVQIDLNPLSLHLTETSQGRALRLTKNGSLIKFENVKTGLITDSTNNLIACFRLENLGFLPRKKSDILKFTPDFMRASKAESAIRFDFESQSPEFPKTSNENNSLPITP